MIACAFCGRMYRDADCGTTCSGCVLAKGCGRSRCPFCGYENQRPLAPKASFWRRLFRAGARDHGPRK